MEIKASIDSNGDLILVRVLDYTDELDEYKDASGWKLNDLKDAFCEALFGKYRIMTEEENISFSNITEAPIITDLDDPEDFNDKQEWLNQDWLNHSWVDVEYMTDPWMQKLAEHISITLKVRKSC